ncbi:MAG: chromosomal replication initiator protein DnaA [Acidobacteria bacterium]|nr:chromosomal replication initiator protein DnaA [Acidobacteriota bacterium]
MNYWDQLRGYVQQRVSAQEYDNWFRGTAFLRHREETLSVGVPDPQTRAWLEGEYAKQIQDGIRELNLPVRTIGYEVEVPRGPQNQAVAALDNVISDPDAGSSLLNPKFTFDTFVVGTCNQFAHAAAKAVATNPSNRYNPLFLYGGVGMGKTHLMHAIGRELMTHFGAMKIVYTSSERFMNEMIAAIRNEKMQLFHQRYRQADVLLIDDIQLLGTKERTQEEFFHTFNQLHDSQKQIVISSDAPPKEIPGLLDRLRSRFEWGLMADIQPPDLETKMAILDKKAETIGVQLPDDVRTFMASKTKSNVRELEGALIRLVAYASLTGATITLQMAHQVLKNIVHVQERRVTIDSIQKAVAEKFGMRQAQLKEKSNTKKVVWPRQIAMYLVKELTDASLPEIGRAFGGKHHTTVLHSITKIEKERLSNPDLNRLIHSLMDSLQ